jgi:hypothetical protein
MATQRYISTSFWDDPWISELDPSEKLLYLYLLTNPLTTIAGVYKITKRRIVNDTGMNQESINTILARFEAAKKAYFIDPEWIIIPTWPRHQRWQNRKKIKLGIISTIQELPESIFSKLFEVGYCFDLSLVAGTVIARKERQTLSGSARTAFIEKRGNRCERCGGDENLTIHHKQALENGGTNDENNLLVLCETCHISVHIPYDKVSEGIAENTVHIPYDKVSKDMWTRKTQDNGDNEAFVSCPHTLSYLINYLDSDSDSDLDTDTDIKNIDVDNESGSRKEKDLPDEDARLYKAIKVTFEKSYGTFENYGKEGKAIKAIIAKAHSIASGHEKEFLTVMCLTYYKLTQEGNEFWKGQPFLPSALNAFGIWPRVMKQVQNKAEQERAVDELSEKTPFEFRVIGGENDRGN